MIGNYEFSVEHTLLVSIFSFEAYFNWATSVCVTCCIFNFCTIFKAFTFYIWKGKPHICSAEIRTCLLLFPDPLFLSLLFECCVLFIPGSFLKLWFVQRKWNFTSKNVMHGTNRGGNTTPEWKMDFRWN